MLGLFALLLNSFSSADTEPAATPAEIMHRVALNQDREQQARTSFIYEEKAHRVERNKNGKLLHEEFRTYLVTPGPKSTEKKLESVHGRYWKKGKYIAYQGKAPEGGLFNVAFDDDTSPENQTRDGMDKDLFPLTTAEQSKYEYELTGERTIKERAVYSIRFRPRDHKDYGWAGEALIDKEEFQPVSVFTQLSRRLPWGVRNLLGTDVPGLGFSVHYTRVDKDLWFPSTYGTEFGVHALFLLNRTVTESTENTNFRRTTVSSQLKFDDTPAQH